MESKWAHPLDFSSKISVTFLWGLAVTIWCLAIVFSFLLGSELFSRSGALVIAILLLVFSLDARKDHEAESEYSQKLAELDERGEPLPSSLVRAYYSEEFEARKFVRHEGYIAAGATLIWGFGDYPMNCLLEIAKC